MQKSVKSPLRHLFRRAKRLKKGKGLADSLTFATAPESGLTDSTDCSDLTNLTVVIENIAQRTAHNVARKLRSERPRASDRHHHQVSVLPQRSLHYYLQNFPKSSCCIAVLSYGVFEIWIVFYLLAFVVIQLISSLLQRWFNYFRNDSLTHIAAKNFKAFFRRVLREGERAVNGDYSRQVMAGYLIYSATAPGESYIAACIRYRMNAINKDFVQQIEEMQLRRLGYETSDRDLLL